MCHAFSGVKKNSHLLLTAMLLVLMPTMAEAVGLGRLKVNSALNEPLNAEIPLTSVSRREVRSLEAGLAPRGAFDVLGIDLPRHLLGIKFTVAKRLDGRYFLQLTTRSAYREPFLHMLVQIEWAGGRLRREYTALIDPPYMSSARPSSITAPRLQNPQEDYEPLPDPLTDEVLKESTEQMAKREEAVKKLPEPMETLPEPLPEEPKLVQMVDEKPIVKEPAMVAETAPVLPEPIADEGSSEGKSIDQIEAEAFGAGGLGNLQAREPEMIAVESTESLPEPITQASQSEPEIFEPYEPYDRGEGLLGPSHIPIIPIVPVETEPVQMTPAFWAAAEQYRVKRGDTLYEIAQRLRRDNSITLNQLMMAIYDANPRAFYGRNVNNLRAGKILTVPEREVVSRRSVRASNQQFRVQYDSWQEHKLRLAQSRAPLEVASQPSQSKPVTVAKVGKAAQREAKLKAQREVKKQQAADAKAKQITAAKAKAKTRKEQKRQAKLKARSDAKVKAKAQRAEDAKAKKLADTKKAKEAEKQKAADKAKVEMAKNAEKPAAKKPAPKPSKTAKARQTEDLLQIVRASMLMVPIELAGQTAETESRQAEKERQILAKRMSHLEESIESKKLKNKEISDKVGKVKRNIESQKRLIDIENPTLAKGTSKKPVAEIPVEPAAKKPVQKKPLKVARTKKPAKRRPAPKPEAKEASVVDTVINTLLGNQFMLMLIGGVILLGAAIFAIYMKRRRKTIADFEESILSADTSTDDLSTDSQDDVGESGDTSFLSDFSQEGMGNIATDEVDPIAEADVYLAYGRDEQAEEILKDAISKHAERAELKLKLLEIYHQRNDVSGFETLAEELYASGGADEVWSRVADMGGQLNPENPMFQGDAPPSAGMLGGGVATLDAGGSNLDMTEMVVPGGEALDDSSGMDDSLDFDIDSPAAGGETEIVSPPSDDGGLTMADGLSMDSGLDLDMGSAAPAAEETPAETGASDDEDFALDFSMDTADVSTDSEEVAADEPAASADDNSLDFSMDLEDMGLETEGEAVVSDDSGDDSLSLDMDADDGDLSLDSGDDSDLDLSSMESDESDDAVSALDMVKAEGGGLPENDDGSLDFSLDSDGDGGDSDEYDLTGEDSELDLSADFGMDDAGGDVEVAEAVDVAEAVGTAEAQVDSDENWDEAATKLDLAKAYIDMGDAEGAKSILDEVMSEGNDEQKAQASELIAQI